MKNILKGVFLTLLFVGFSSCEPYEDSSPGSGNVVDKGDIKVSITPVENEDNVFHFKLLTPNCLGNFICEEADIKESGVEFTTLVSLAGEYRLKVQVYNKAGLSEIAEIPFSVDKDVVLDTSEMEKALLGDGNNVWRIDGTVAGHIGCGPEDSQTNDWWAPGPNSLNAALYDDDMIFVQGGKFELKNYGKSLMNESTGSLFPDGNTAESFVTSSYTPATNATWRIVGDPRTNTYWLHIDKGFPAYGVNPDAIQGGKYKIVSLKDGKMHITYLPGGISWNYHLTMASRSN